MVVNPNIVFEDDFSGSGLSNWILESTNNRVYIGGGVLELSSSSSRFPYLHTGGSVFPSEGDFRLTFRIRYSQIGVCGVGLMISSAIVPAGLGQDAAAAQQMQSEQTGISAGIWQDNKSGLLMQFRSASDRVDIPFSGNDSRWHQVSIEYSAGKYKLLLDDSLAYLSKPTSYRPRFIWMGHPADLGAGAQCAWDTLQIASVLVQRLP